MTYPLPAWTDSPITTTPLDSSNLLLYNNAINGLSSTVQTLALKLPFTTVQGAPSVTAAANTYVLVSTASNAVTVNFPIAPANLTVVGVKVVTLGTSNAVTLQLGGSDVFNVAGGSQAATLTLSMQAGMFQYNSATAVWVKISDDLPLSQLDARYSLTPGYSLGGQWGPNVYGSLFENMERDAASSTLIMNGSSARTQLVLLGLVPAGSYSVFKLYVTNTPSGGVITAALFSAGSMSSTSWARLGSGNVTPAIAAGLVSTSLAFTLASPAYVMLQMVYTTTATTYDSFAAGPSGTAAFLNPPSGTPVSAIGTGSSAPGTTLNPTTGFTGAAQKIWCALA